MSGPIFNELLKDKGEQAQDHGASGNLTHRDVIALPGSSPRPQGYLQNGELGVVGETEIGSREDR